MEDRNREWEVWEWLRFGGECACYLLLYFGFLRGSDGFIVFLVLLLVPYILLRLAMIFDD
jgi:hypothetical protein